MYKNSLVLILVLLISCGASEDGDPAPDVGVDTPAAADTVADTAAPDTTTTDTAIDTPQDTTPSYPPLLVPAAPVEPYVYDDALPIATEGLAFHGDHLYLSAIDGRILRTPWPLDVEVFAELPAGDVAGLTVGPDEALYVARFTGGRIERIPIDDPTDVTTHLEVDTPNSLAFVGDDLWFTSSGKMADDLPGHLGRLPAGGEPEILIPDVPYANGLAFCPDHTCVYLTSTDPGAVLRAPITDGQPGTPETIAEGPDLAVADGLAVYPDGTLFIAGFGTGRIYAWTEAEGLRPVAELPNAGLMGTASLAFGTATGFGQTSLYATNLMKPTLIALDMAME